ncbi:hypothetical protein [Solidesulfovibrio magneticus]|uniref:Uncharacterized protein n=1 Tax=Solidesulfovibrio magneticus (strain ATCC 700980 / DSM 13731 / RS-1) TaxID=573370 RepID=C4XJD7_SOLM1|nr:hypothetical protein [Solidesulfovibrio magneticus]BAH76687.1 hypothetical protein DMR_31960 [Solidesulfovibrio magneticus RS-1]
MLAPEKDAVVSYALASKKNLEIALNVIESRNQILVSIYNSFGQKLKSAFFNSLEDSSMWTYKNTYADEGIVSYAGIAFQKQAWANKDIWLNLEAQSGGVRDFIIGLSKDKDIEGIVNNSVVDELNKEFGPGSQSKYWVWFQRVKQFSFWDDKKVLLALKYDDEPVCYFSDLFSRINKILMPAIDDYCA